MRSQHKPLLLFHDFNPHIHEGCDLLYVTNQSINNFNPRIREGCDHGKKYTGISWNDFNPRIREGCDSFCLIKPIDWMILIHASTKDATGNSSDTYKAAIILIHASTKDATAKSYKIGSDFAALFRKFIQKLGIVIFRISIF